MNVQVQAPPGVRSSMSNTSESVAAYPFGSALLGAAAVLVWNDVAEYGREQFYEWHDKEHIPERLAIPGFRRGRRYRTPAHSPEWLTMYEADDLGVVTSPEYLERLNSPTPGTTKALQYFRNTSRAVCRIVCSSGSSSGGHMLAMRLDVPGAQSDAMRAYLSTEVFPRALILNGVVACHLYAADQDASYLRTAESNTREFDVPSWVLLAEATNLHAAEHLRMLINGPELQRLGVSVRRDATIYSLEICRLASPATTS
jgi:hypothetical protein